MNMSIGVKRKSWFGFVWRWGKRAVGLLIAGILCFAAAAWILGNTPVNQAFRHADAENGIEILVINNGVHVDLVLPIDIGITAARTHFTKEHDARKRRYDRTTRKLISTKAQRTTVSIQ